MKRTLLYALTASLLMLVAAPVPADVLLIINKHGAFTIDTESSTLTPIPLNVDSIIIDSGAGIGKPGPGPGPDPDDPKKPVPDAKTKEMAELATKYVKQKPEAQALIALLDLMIDLVDKGSLAEKDIDRAMKTSIGVIESQLRTDDRLEDWLEDVTDLAPNDKLDKATLVCARDGVGIAWKIDVDKLTDAVNTARSNVASGQSTKTAAENATDDTAEAFDIAMIIQLIMAILELLKTFGIIGG